MPLDIRTLCQYRLERAKEDILTAENNQQAGFYKAAINRSYYAIFHSIRAVNILDGFDASKHSSVIAHFNQLLRFFHRIQGGLRGTIGTCKRIFPYSRGIPEEKTG